MSTSSTVQPDTSPTPTTDYALTLDNVSKDYNKVPALVDINLQIAAGTIYALLGPSGCGEWQLTQVAATDPRAPCKCVHTRA